MPRVKKEEKEYYTKDEVKQLLDKEQLTFTVFREWMYGQTCPLVEGKICYFTWDVGRFIRNFGNSLTSKYYRGELPSGWYYVLFLDSPKEPSITAIFDKPTSNFIIEVLAPVPSYEEYRSKETIRV